MNGKGNQIKRERERKGGGKERGGPEDSEKRGFLKGRKSPERERKTLRKYLRERLILKNKASERENFSERKLGKKRTCRKHPKERENFSERKKVRKREKNAPEASEREVKTEK